LRYVVKSQPELSLFYEVLSDGTAGHTISAEQKEIVREWILRGARE
jgi:hypothetical protein